MRAISNEPFNFDHWSSSESDTLVGISFCKLLDHANVKILSLDARSSVVREELFEEAFTLIEVQPTPTDGGFSDAFKQILLMSAETTSNRAVRSSTVAICVSYISDFRLSQKKKSKGLRSGKREG
ncbi:hypothetical protein TNCV_4774251 [Trichonephila clavipes]|nr:hypothetical protein TNCV_4774251 [Trichonephila clavipes]